MSPRPLFTLSPGALADALPFAPCFDHTHFRADAPSILCVERLAPGRVSIVATDGRRLVRITEEDPEGAASPPYRLTLKTPALRAYIEAISGALDAAERRLGARARNLLNAFCEGDYSPPLDFGGTMADAEGLRELERSRIELHLAEGADVARLVHPLASAEIPVGEVFHQYRSVLEAHEQTLWSPPMNAAYLAGLAGALAARAEREGRAATLQLGFSPDVEGRPSPIQLRLAAGCADATGDEDREACLMGFGVARGGAGAWARRPMVHLGDGALPTAGSDETGEEGAA